MRRIYLLFPLLGLTAFAGYHHYWDARHTAARAYPREFLDPYAGRDGHREALADLAHGKLGVVSYGLPAPWVQEYREVLQRDYGIEYRAIAGCMVTDGTLKYAAAYNQVMERRILARHGAHVFDEAEAKAGALYARRHPPSNRD